MLAREVNFTPSLLDGEAAGAEATEDEAPGLEAVPEGFEFALEFESVAFERVEAFEDEAVIGVEVCDLFLDVDAVSTPRASASGGGG